MGLLTSAPLFVFLKEVDVVAMAVAEGGVVSAAVSLTDVVTKSVTVGDAESAAVSSDFFRS